ncbi:uncharacterized protein [Lolium perenne]|uniref:uncharacterized protein n=1 Tax=Lolium perenne TaxID=4522 RepID=UPI0021EA17AE|nr:uncharacterized protein LOC127309650 [Lolium perenne]
MSAVRFLASALKTTPRRPLVPNYQAVLEKVEGLKAVNIQVDSISKSIQELEANARSQRVVWRFNERKIEHGLKRDDPAHRRSYHLALGITSAVMYFAPKASKRFS